MPKPFLTPPDTPETVECRTLKIPSSKYWLGIFNSALLPLTETWNYEQVHDTDLTPAEVAAACALILQEYFETPGCSACTLPGGSPIFRLGLHGRYEQLVGDEWVEPEGDYTLPPTPGRTEPTSDERRCLAAANAAKVLELLYEDLSDSYNAGLTQAEAIAHMVEVLAIILAATVWGVLVAAVLAVGLAIFGVIFDTLEFIGADVWTTDFNDRLLCVLYECSISDTDVVRFDYDCFLERLANATELTTDASQIRLFGQIAYMMSFLGTEALDAAGATTSVLTADCDACEDNWCFTFDLTEVTADGVPYTENGCTAAWSSGLGWYTTKGGGCAVSTGASVLTAINVEFDAAFIRRVVVVGTSLDRTTGTACAVAFPQINRGGVPAVTCIDITNGDPLGCELVVNDTITGITAEFQCAASDGVSHATGTSVIKQVTFYGTGFCPFGDPNCIE